MLRTLFKATFIGVALLSFGCSGDSNNDEAKSEPEIIRSEPGALPGGAPPAGIDIIRTSIGAAAGSILPTGAPATADTSGSTTRGLTVRHSETDTLPADQAFIVALLPIRPPIPGPAPALSDRDRTQVLGAIESLGIKKEDVNLDSNPSFGPFTSVSVKIPIKDVGTQGKRILDALEGVLGRPQTSGVRFGISNCTTALDPLRRKAFAAAGDEAKTIAQAASLNLGPIAAVSEQVGSTVSYGPPAADPCNAAAAPKGPPPSDIQSLEAPSEVKVSLQLNLTYSLGADSSAGGITSTGNGSVTAKADEAYVVVIAGDNLSGGPFGSPPLAKKTRDELVTKLKGLKIDEGDIEIGKSFNGPSGNVVSVEVPAKDAAQKGKEIVGIVEDVLGRSQIQGAVFSHSNCSAVLTEARKQAFVDAKAGAESLAGMAGVKLGRLVALGDVGQAPVPSGPPPSRNPCDFDPSQVALGGPYGSQLKPFDSEPEFAVSTGVLLTYAIE
jgi:uncharacterized protein YggE